MSTRLLAVRDVMAILQAAADVLKQEPNVVEVEAPVTVGCPGSDCSGCETGMGPVVG